MTIRKKPTKSEREQRVLEAQQQAFQLNETLIKLARGIHKTRDRELMAAFQWLHSFLLASFEKTADLEWEKQTIREKAAEANRKFTDKEYDAAATEARSDKDIARKLNVSTATVARYKAVKNRKPSFTDEVRKEVRTERKRMKRSPGKS